MSRQHDREALAAAHKSTKARPKPTPEPQPDEDLRSSVGNSGMGKLIGPSVTDTIEAEMGAGKPLSATPGAFAAKGDAEDVRIHDDGTAADLSRELGAVAFTFGRDIFLAGHAPDIGSSDGQAMLRHELTHVDQQAESGTTRPRRVSSPNSPAEQQATRAQHGDAGAKSAAGAGAVHRQEEEEEMMMPMRETVHRQEEEEEMMMPMRETVHRQEEEEEMMMPMRETVHRQEEEEEMMMPMRETVHRQEEEELQGETAVGGPEAGAAESAEEREAEPSNPALSALYEGTVLSNHRAAIEALRGRPRRARAAMDSVHQAADGVMALVGVYRESDPRLYERLGKYYNALIVTWTQLSAVVDGPAPVSDIADLLASDNSLGLGESLQGELH